MIKRYGDEIKGVNCTYICDEKIDLSKAAVAKMGNTAFVIHTSDIYVMDSQKVWYCITNASADPVQCDCVEESTIWTEIPEN